MNVNTQLKKEIERLYARMQELDPDSKEYADVNAQYVKLVSQKTDRGDRTWRNSNEIGKVVLTAGMTVTGIVLGYALETKGITLRGFAGKFLDKLTKY